MVFVQESKFFTDGRSGAKFEISEIGECWWVEKNVILSDRNLANAKKQKDCSLSLSSVELLSADFQIIGDSIIQRMPLISGYSCARFVQMCDVASVQNICKGLVEYIAWILKESELSPPQCGEFLSKFESVKGLLNFLPASLIDRISSIVCAKTLNYDRTGFYHGDFTLGNMIYDASAEKIFLIDPLVTFSNSVMQDICKIRQDIQFHWFLRNEATYVQPRSLIVCRYVMQALDKVLQTHGISDSDLVVWDILNTMRVGPYCQDDSDRQWVKETLERIIEENS